MHSQREFLNNDNHKKMEQIFLDLVIYFDEFYD